MIQQYFRKTIWIIGFVSIMEMTALGCHQDQEHTFEGLSKSLHSSLQAYTTTKANYDKLFDGIWAHVNSTDTSDVEKAKQMVPEFVKEGQNLTAKSKEIVELCHRINGLKLEEKQKKMLDLLEKSVSSRNEFIFSQLTITQMQVGLKYTKFATVEDQNQALRVNKDVLISTLLRSKESEDQLKEAKTLIQANLSLFPGWEKNESP